MSLFVTRYPFGLHGYHRPDGDGTPPPKDGGAPPPKNDGTPPPKDGGKDGGTPPKDGGTPPKDTPWFTDGWRNQYAGTDAKKLQRLERYASPSAALDALFAAESKIHSGELKAVRPYPEKGTDEEKAAWRAEAGVPADHKGYEIKLEDGLVIGDDDKPMVEKFLQGMHASNAHPSHVNAALNTYYKIQAEDRARVEQEDAAFQKASEDTLRAEMGGDYRTNFNLIKALVQAHPGLEEVMTARGSDGRLLGDNPETIRSLVALARTINPVVTLTPGQGENMSQAVETEIEGIEKMMRDDPPGARAAYFKDQKKQARYLELVGWRDRQKEAKK